MKFGADYSFERQILKVGFKAAVRPDFYKVKLPDGRNLSDVMLQKRRILRGLGTRTENQLAVLRSRMAMLAQTAGRKSLTAVEFASLLAKPIPYLQLSKRTDVRRIILRKLASKLAEKTKKVKPVVNQSMANVAQSAMPVVNIDTSDFDRAMVDYIKFSQKDLKTVLNNKGYWIAAAAVYETRKADAKAIREKLTRPATFFKRLNVAESIVLKKWKEEGKKGDMTQLKKEARKLISSKTRAVGFLRSGWVPAMLRFGSLTENKKDQDRPTRSALLEKKLIRGQEKGGGQPMMWESWKGTASLWNSIEAEGNQVANNFLKMGLQKALNKEAASMRTYVEKKMARNAARFNRSV